MILFVTLDIDWVGDILLSAFGNIIENKCAKINILIK